MPQKHTICAGGQLIDLTSPIVMAILNLTEDSFYASSRVSQREVTDRALQMVEDGAAILDVGACSTRPGSQPPEASEETDRLLMAVEQIRKYNAEIAISIDTYRAEVADALLNRFPGLIVNDVSGGEMDEQMFQVVARHRVPYVLMHMQGTPATMQNSPEYHDVVREVMRYLLDRADKLRMMGVGDIIIDPGFGFGKTLEHNYQLLRHLDRFSLIGLPILAGLSRKSMISRLLGVEPVDALFGTQAVNMLALMGGAKILRVHDVRPAYEAIKIFEAYEKAE